MSFNPSASRLRVTGAQFVGKSHSLVELTTEHQNELIYWISVYEAEQMPLGRFVALKLLPGQVAANAQQKERFLREAKAAAKLHHTNIVPVFGFGEADHIPYYAMQFICGQGVDAVIAELRAQFEGRYLGCRPHAVAVCRRIRFPFRSSEPVTPRLGRETITFR